MPPSAATAGEGALRPQRLRPSLFRNGWELALMIAGFVLFWPFGLAVLGFYLWRSTMFRDSWKSMHKRVSCSNLIRGNESTGNSAFDTYKVEVLRRLDEERRTLAEEERAFDDFLVRLRQAKDREEFDRFMQSRGQAS